MRKAGMGNVPDLARCFAVPFEQPKYSSHTFSSGMVGDSYL